MVATSLISHRNYFKYRIRMTVKIFVIKVNLTIKLCLPFRDGKAPDYFTLINYMCDTLMESRGGFKTYINFCCTRASLLRNIGK